MGKRNKRKKKKKPYKIVVSAGESPQEKEEKKEPQPRKKKIFLVVLLLLFIFILLPASFIVLKKSGKREIHRNGNLNLLLITLDTFRGDRVGYAGYDIETPSLDSLAHDGASFMNAVCQVPLTLPSHASIFTGTNPLFHQIRNNEDYYLRDDFTTLAEILKKNGFVTAAFISAFVLDSQFGLSQGFDFYDDRYETPEDLKPYGPQRRSEDTYRSAASWIDKNYQKKFFVWVHFFDPHYPYSPPSPFNVQYKSRPYDGEIAYTDVYVGKLVQTLKEKNIFTKTLTVVVGDHGEDLWQHSEPTHGIFLYDAVLKVPFIVCCPQTIPAGIRIEEQIRSIDVFPTVLDLFELDIPTFCHGISLVPTMEGKKIKELEKSFAETYYPLLAHGWSAQESIRTNRWKYIISPRSELYDLNEDPGETRNVIEARQDIVSKLKQDMGELKKRFSSSRDLPIRELNPEEKEKLRSLGYAGGATPSNWSQEGRPDPKDRIDVMKKLYAAKTAIRGRELEKAEIILNGIKKEDPGNSRVYQSMGNIYLKRKEWNKAIEEFKEAIKLNPRDVDSYFLLSQSYYEGGMGEEAIKAAQATLNLRPKHLMSLKFLAFYFKSKRDIEKSIVYLEKMLQITPSNIKVGMEYADALVMAEAYVRAIEEYQNLLAKNPKNPQIYNKLGLVYFYLDDYQAAVDFLEKEVALKENASSYFLLGSAYGKLGNYKKAVDSLTQYLILSSPKDPRRQKAEGALQFYRSQIK